MLQKINFTELELPDSSSDEEYNPNEEEVCNIRQYDMLVCVVHFFLEWQVGKDLRYIQYTIIKH